MGRRKFAKNSEQVRHFRLVSRSQNDACVDEPDATPLVLEPMVKPGDERRTGLTEAELLTIPESLQTLGADVFGLGERKGSDDLELDEDDDEDSDEEGEEKDELAHLEGDCYFPRDGYNYEQHLKRVSGVGKAGGVVGVILEAPKKADCAPKEKKELCIMAPQSKEEEEVARALEFAEEYEELDEDDLEAILPGGAAEDLDVVMWGPTVHEYNGKPDLTDLAAFKAAYKAQMFGGETAVEGGGVAEAFGDDEAEGDFDDFLANEYGDDDIGACDEEDIEGHMTSKDCEEAVDEYLQDKAEENDMLHSLNEPIKGKYDNVPRVTEETKAIIAKHYEYMPDSDEETISGGEEDTDSSRLWDCETVLSTLSNISNRPGKIDKIKIIGSKKKDALPKVAEGAEDEDEDDEDTGSVVELPDVITERKRGETAEERKARKASVKEMRRICRKMKKESKEMYKTEAARLPGQQATADVKAKQRYQRL